MMAKAKSSMTRIVTHYELRFTVRMPDGVIATPEEAAEWLRWHMHDTNSIAEANPLYPFEPEPLRGTFRIFETAWDDLPKSTS